MEFKPHIVTINGSKHMFPNYEVYRICKKWRRLHILPSVLLKNSITFNSARSKLYHQHRIALHAHTWYLLIFTAVD